MEPSIADEKLLNASELNLGGGRTIAPAAFFYMSFDRLVFMHMP